jgi:hypothetical protein
MALDSFSQDRAKRDSFAEERAKQEFIWDDSTFSIDGKRFQYELPAITSLMEYRSLLHELYIWRTLLLTECHERLKVEPRDLYSLNFTVKDNNLVYFYILMRANALQLRYYAADQKVMLESSDESLLIEKRHYTDLSAFLSSIEKRITQAYVKGLEEYIYRA